MVTDLLDGEFAWRDFTMPGASRAVRLARLGPAEAGAPTLVEFPVGWARPAVGHYACGEEFVVLRGELHVSGIVYRVGHCAWLPPGTVRYDSMAPDGALALAWFSGAPRWTDDEVDRSSGPSRRTALDTVTIPAGGLRLRGGGPGDADGETWLHEAVPSPPGRPAHLLWPGAARWAPYEPGGPTPKGAGRVLVRIS